MSRRQQKFRLMADLAEGYAKLSTCTRASVGCVLFDEDFTKVHGVGYNGPPRGLPNDSCDGDPGACGCVHAEANALVKAGDAARGAVLFTTTCPCLHCAGLVLNAGVRTVVYLVAYRNPGGRRMLERGGIPVYSRAEYYALLGEETTDDRAAERVHGRGRVGAAELEWIERGLLRRRDDQPRP